MSFQTKLGQLWPHWQQKPTAVDSQVRLVSATESFSFHGIYDLETLLLEALPLSENQRLSVVVGKRCFHMWLTRVPDQAGLPFDECITYLNAFFHCGRESSCVFLFHGHPASYEEGKDLSQSYVVAAVDADFRQSRLSGINDCLDSDALGDSLSSNTRPWYKPVATLKRKVIAGALAFIIGLFIFVAIHPLVQSNGGTWIRYDTHGSIGPRYQLQFDHHNASTWTKNHEGWQDKWTLRIDDQALVPVELWDEEEEHYQQWFRKHFPETEEVRQRELFVDPGFLGDPYAIQVPADKSFHTAHCILALRRYWKARESGRHVCPRDIDYKHMKHCLDSLDEIAFPEIPGGHVHSHDKLPQTTKPGISKRAGEIVLLWKTKVCW